MTIIASPFVGTNNPVSKPETPVWLPDRRLEMPELFIPGKKPVGNVKVDDAAIPSSFGECILALGFANNPASCIRRRYIDKLSVGSGGYDRKAGGFYIWDDNQYVTAASAFPLNSTSAQTWIISFSIWSPIPDGETSINYVVGHNTGSWAHVMFSGSGDSKQLGYYRAIFHGFGVYQSDLKDGWNRVTITGSGLKVHSAFVNNDTYGTDNSADSPYYLHADHFFNEQPSLARQRGPGVIGDLQIFWKVGSNVLPSDEVIWAFNKDPYQFLTPK